MWCFLALQLKQSQRNWTSYTIVHTITTNECSKIFRYDGDILLRIYGSFVKLKYFNKESIAGESSVLKAAFGHKCNPLIKHCWLKIRRPALEEDRFRIGSVVQCCLSASMLATFRATLDSPDLEHVFLVWQYPNQKMQAWWRVYTEHLSSFIRKENHLLGHLDRFPLVSLNIHQSGRCMASVDNYTNPKSFSRYERGPPSLGTC